MATWHLESVQEKQKGGGRGCCSPHRLVAWHLESMKEKQKGVGGGGLLLTSSFGCLAPRIRVRETKGAGGGGYCSPHRLVARSLTATWHLEWVSVDG